jgi:hypothetical protein
VGGGGGTAANVLVITIVAARSVRMLASVPSEYWMVVEAAPPLPVSLAVQSAPAGMSVSAIDRFAARRSARG